jgi:hypothetical protein
MLTWGVTTSLPILIHIFYMALPIAQGSQTSNFPVTLFPKAFPVNLTLALPQCQRISCRLLISILSHFSNLKAEAPILFHNWVNLIPGTYPMDEGTEEGKLMIDLYEIAFTELIHSVDTIVTQNLKMIMLLWHGKSGKRNMIQSLIPLKCPINKAFSSKNLSILRNQSYMSSFQISELALGILLLSLNSNSFSSMNCQITR